MAEAVVHQLEVVQIREHEREWAVEAVRALELELEHLHEAPPVREPGQLVRHRLGLHEAVETGVLERDRRLSGEPAGELPRLGREPVRRRIEDERPAVFITVPEWYG